MPVKRKCFSRSPNIFALTPYPRSRQQSRNPSPPSKQRVASTNCALIGLTRFVFFCHLLHLLSKKGMVYPALGMRLAVAASDLKTLPRATRMEDELFVLN